VGLTRLGDWVRWPWCIVVVVTSSTSSSSTKDPSIVIPKPSSNALKPNAHSYAIKMTSTGILSCSSSPPDHQVHSIMLTIPSSSPPPASCIETSFEAGYGGSSRAIASPFILHKTTISRPTLPALVWGGGVGTLASILLPMAMGELKA